MRKVFNAVALAIAGLLAYVVATPYLPQPEDRVGQFYERAIACLADVLVPSADAATIGPVDAFTPAFGGRCTLTTLTPVMTASATSATTVYYTPYVHDRIAIYNGSKLVNWVFGELSNLTTASSTSSAGPAVVAASSVYDLYVWNNAGTLRLTRSPAWTSATSRGSGAATAQQDCTTVPGVCTNAVAITNGPAANRGTFVCTVASDVGSTIDWQFGRITANWGQAIHNVWNQNNRVLVSGFLGDSTDSWTYQLTAIRAANANTTARVSFVLGASEDSVSIGGYMRWLSGAATVGIAGIGLDSTTTFAQLIGFGANSTMGQFPYSYSGYPGIGTHFLSANEACNAATNAVTFYGDFANPTIVQTGMTYSLRM